MNFKRLASFCALVAAMLISSPVFAQISAQLKADIQAAVGRGDATALNTLLAQNAGDKALTAEAAAVALAATEGLASTSPSAAADIASNVMALIDTGTFRTAANTNEALAAQLLAASQSAANIASNIGVQAAKPSVALSLAVKAGDLANQLPETETNRAQVAAVVEKSQAVTSSPTIIGAVSNTELVQAKATLGISTPPPLAFVGNAGFIGSINPNIFGVFTSNYYYSLIANWARLDFTANQIALTLRVGPYGTSF